MGGRRYNSQKPPFIPTNKLTLKIQLHKHLDARHSNDSGAISGSRNFEERKRGQEERGRGATYPPVEEEKNIYSFLFFLFVGGNSRPVDN